MIRFGVVITVIILLGACCSTLEHAPEPAPDWSEYTSAAHQYSETQLLDAQKAALLRYQAHPDDESRMKLAWLLSQGRPSRQQLERSLELCREIPSDGMWSAHRNLLQQDVQNMIELQTTRGRVLELEAQLETKNTQLEAIEAQLQAMKDIETRMTEEIDPDRKEPR